VAKGKVSSVLRHLRRLVVRQGDGGLSDAQLLERFARERDQAAFEVLVWRHGAMVLGVCQRVLSHRQDAEDALQATFLALVRQAGSISRRGSVGSWLHKVAYRTALRARAQRQKQAVDPARVEELPAPLVRDEESWREVRSVLDEELERLPEKYRTPLVLCYLEGLTNKEVAEQLACPIGTVFTRLSRGRDLLRARLTQRGVALSAGLLATVLAEQAPAAPLAAGLVQATVEAAVLFAAGSGAAGVLSPNVVALTEGVLKMMWFNKLKLVVAAFVTLAVAGSGLGLVAFRVAAREQAGGRNDAPEDAKPAEAAARPAKETLRYGGKSFDEWRTTLMTDLKPETRVEAIKALSTFGVNGYGREAAAAIVEAVRGYDMERPDADDGKILVAAQAALTKIGDESVPALVEELKKGKKRGRQFAAGTLLQGYGPEAKGAVPALAAAIKDEDKSTRDLAARALMTIDRDGNAVTTVIATLADRDEDIRLLALMVVQAYGPKARRALPQILAIATKDDSASNRRLAIEALQSMKTEAKIVLPALRRALRDDSLDVRAVALQYLQQLGPAAKEAVPELVAGLKTAKDKLQPVSRLIVVKVGSVNGVREVPERIWIVDTLGKIGPAAKEAVPALTELLKSTRGEKDQNLANAIYWALRKMNE